MFLIQRLALVGIAGLPNEMFYFLRNRETPNFVPWGLGVSCNGGGRFGGVGLIVRK